MNTAIFIGNLNFDTTNETLSSFLHEYGAIKSCEIIIDKFSFKSKGYARVMVENEEIAHKIIESLNGRELEGRPLKIALYNR